MIEENETEIASSNLPNVINMSKVKCSILEHGYNAIEMPFYFCNCDIDQKNPICIECSLICHKGHVLSKIKNNDPTKEKEKVLCECGMKCHQMDENVEKLDVYEPKCYFHEFSINSKINVYYVGPTSKICMFCFNFCNEKDENPFIRTIADSSETVPNCECRNELHHDVKSIYLKINLIFKEKANFENLYPAQIINLMYLSKKTFKNVFISFDTKESLKKVSTTLNSLLMKTFIIQTILTSFYPLQLFLVIKTILGIFQKVLKTVSISIFFIRYWKRNLFQISVVT